MANRTDSEYLSTLERGLRVMRSFSAQRSEMTISQVAVETDLNPAVVRRCLNTLEQLGYIAKRDNLFSLTAEVLTFGTHYVESAHLETSVRPHLQRVRDVMGDSSSMALLSRGEVLYLVHVSTDRRVQIDASVGTRFPAYSTSMGKVPPSGLAESIKREIRERMLVTSEIKLVNYGSMPRETYKSKLVDYSYAV